VEERGGGVAELLGTHEYQLDPKGRVSLPARFREAFAEGAFLTLGQDRCLYVFPRAEWDRVRADIDALPLSDTASRAYQRAFLGQSGEVKLDAQGRVTIPPKLRELAGIRKEVSVLGLGGRMEIWDRETYERYAAANAGAYETGTLDPRRNDR
jgi:MraZ protein